TLAEAQQGCAEAQYALYARYEYGEEVRKDGKQAFKWLFKAALQGHPAAEFEVGRRFLTGAGIVQDTAEAAHWFQRSAERGHPQAQFELSRLYLAGSGVPRSEQAAMRWLQKAAKGGYAEAQADLGMAHMWGVGGIAEDARLAADWLRKAARQGHARARFTLFRWHLEDAMLKGDRTETIVWLRDTENLEEALEGTDLQAPIEAGTLAPRNITEAIRWCRTAAYYGSGVTRRPVPPPDECQPRASHASEPACDSPVAVAAQ
ncbi:MAG: sel1 repeat family protein, partial [Verrucomicrobiae bacterium]|nr:sel1 repeat family protein [Verrucomicrobiae bacterium]